MNRTYDYNSYESNCKPVRIKNERGEENDILDIVGDLILKAISVFSSTAFKVFISVVCLVGFVGVIGSIEAGTLSVGGGIIASVFMVFIELLCISSSQKKTKNNH